MEVNTLQRALRWTPLCLWFKCIIVIKVTRNTTMIITISTQYQIKTNNTNYWRVTNMDYSNTKLRSLVKSNSSVNTSCHKSWKQIVLKNFTLLISLDNSLMYQAGCTNYAVVSVIMLLFGEYMTGWFLFTLL